MSDSVLAALERLEAAIVEIEMQTGAMDEPLAEARLRLQDLALECAAHQLRDLDLPCQWIGSLLDLFGEKKGQPSQEMVDLLLGPLDFMRRIIFLNQQGANINGSWGGQPPPPVAASRAESPPPALTDQSERQIANPAQVRAAPSAIKVETQKLDGLLDILGELVITFALSSRHSALTQDQNRDLQENMSALGGLLESLEKQVASIRMLQLNNLFMRMQRLVRDVSTKVGKTVELVFKGGDLELDKGLIEELNDPLVHILRNAVDHGVEDPDDRLAAGKPAQALLELKAERRDQSLIITVTDDGQGLNRQRIYNKALERGLVKAGRTYSDEEIYGLITESGFSTAQAVTEISGRGVGLDVVARAVEKMGAQLKIDSTPGIGSSFAIHLPLNRVITDGITDAILITVGGEIYAIPSRQVIEVFSYDNKRIFNVSGLQVVEYRGVYCPLIDLAQAMDCHGQGQAKPAIVIIAVVGGRQIGMTGEELIGHQQVVLRSLEKRAFPGVTAVSGCAMMGDKMGLMLDMEGLVANLASPDMDYNLASGKGNLPGNEALEVFI